MKVHVVMLDEELALVELRPSWLERLLGARPYDDVARCMSEPGERREWVWDSPFGGPIDLPSIRAELDATAVRWAAERRLAKLMRDMDAVAPSDPPPASAIDRAAIERVIARLELDHAAVVTLLGDESDRVGWLAPEAAVALRTLLAEVDRLTAPAGGVR